MSMLSETVPPIRALGGPWGQEELQDLVGNMWNAFSYIRVKMAAVGAVDWKSVQACKAARAKKKAEVADEALSSDLNSSQD
jgi:hypothetical protein